jgi:coproporphyrinogen III oxidase
MALLVTAPGEFRKRVSSWIEQLHDETTAYFAQLDRGGAFREDRWERPGGGGGVTRVMTDGNTYEKAGVNRSAVDGVLDPSLAQRIGARPGLGLEPNGFFATGLSVVAHPRSPMVPTIHLNVRYFEITADSGEPIDAWFGGGTDLTPTYPFPEDVIHFHRTLRSECNRHHPDFYPRFKTWCDHYFVNTHRSEERRGVGGIFFDHIRPGEAGVSRPELLAFAQDIGAVLPAAYGPLVERRRDLSFGQRERHFQLLRRGRYAEFNLVHDRGTLFGLQSGARIESVLMSLPPLAAWDYAPEYAAGSFEAELLSMLEPRDWAAESL